MGPYDRRTIVGMRIKKTLTSEHVLEGTDGSRLTGGDLIGQRRGAADFQPQRTGNFSIVQATYAASLRGVSGTGIAIPRFQGEAELRVQPDVLRLAGRFRKGLFGWKEDRVKLPRQDIVHAQARGTEVELGLRPGEGRPEQRVRLELFTAQAAAELVHWLPDARPWPQADAGGAATPAVAVRSGNHLLWASVGGITCVAFVLLAVMLARRLY